MMQMRKVLDAWDSPDFRDVLKQEIEAVGVAGLPLQQGLTTSSYALDGDISVMIIGVSEGEDAIVAKAGIFYKGIIPGCSCADDPTPIDENSEYCEVRFSINKLTADATVTLLA